MPGTAWPCRLLTALFVGIGSEVNLIVAALDLQLVRLLRGATNGGAGIGGVPGLPPGPAPSHIASRPRHEPEPVIEPRRRIEPEPRFEPRPVIHPEPRVDPPHVCEAPHESRCPDPTSRSPLVPPWRMPLPIERPLPPAQKVKLIIRPPDVVTKGMLIDFFV